MENLESAGEKVESKPKSRARYVPEIVVGAGYLLFFVLLAVACVAALFMMYSGRTAKQNPLETSLPPLTPTPRILAIPSPDAPGVFYDDFGKDTKQWGRDLTYDTRVAVKDGGLVVESVNEGRYGFVACDACPSTQEPYVVQAAFATDSATNNSFGIAFRAGYANDNFYLFSINTESRQFKLYRHSMDRWWMRASWVTDRIRAFPATNTLGVSVNGDTLELYINGLMVTSYEEAGVSLQGGHVGFYVDNTNFHLFVDDLIVERTGAN